MKRMRKRKDLQTDILDCGYFQNQVRPPQEVLNFWETFPQALKKLWTLFCVIIHKKMGENCPKRLDLVNPLPPIFDSNSKIVGAHVTCHMSHVICDHFFFVVFFYKLLELDGAGSTITKAYSVFFFKFRIHPIYFSKFLFSYFPYKML